MPALRPGPARELPLHVRSLGKADGSDIQKQVRRSVVGRPQSIADQDCFLGRIGDILGAEIEQRPKRKIIGGAGMDGSAGGRAAARAVFPWRLHAAGGHCRYRLPEQGGDLRPTVQGVGRDDDDHRSAPRSVELD